MLVREAAIEGEVLHVLARDAELVWLPAGVVEAPGEGELMELIDQAKILELVGRAEIISRRGNDLADWIVSISLLRKGRAGVVGVPLVGRGERHEGIREFPLHIVEVIIRPA